MKDIRIGAPWWWKHAWSLIKLKSGLVEPRIQDGLRNSISLKNYLQIPEGLYVKYPVQSFIFIFVYYFRLFFPFSIFSFPLFFGLLTEPCEAIFEAKPQLETFATSFIASTRLPIGVVVYIHSIEAFPISDFEAIRVAQRACK